VCSLHVKQSGEPCVRTAGYKSMLSGWSMHVPQQENWGQLKNQFRRRTDCCDAEPVGLSVRKRCVNRRAATYVLRSMKLSVSDHSNLWLIWGSVLILFTLRPVFAAQNACEVGPAGSTYSYVKGDVKDSRSLQLTRSFNSKGTLQNMICAGEVRILPARDGLMHLSIELREALSTDMTAFVRTIESQDDNAVISLAYPKNLRPYIILGLPPDRQLHTVINLGVGELSVRGDAIQGDRQIDVGAGKLTIYLHGDGEYSTLKANVGLGSFHDRRPGGVSAHFSTRQVLRGKGAGQIDANVGSGSIELRREE
jgi:hypothetical protein